MAAFLWLFHSKHTGLGLVEPFAAEILNKRGIFEFVLFKCVRDLLATKASS
jgi:hypothetical protein